MNLSTPLARLAPATLTCLALAAGVTACGDESAPSEAGATPTAVVEESEGPLPMSVDDYTAAGNAICDRTGEEIDAVFPDFPGPPPIPRVRKLGADLAGVLQSSRDDIAALVPPLDLASKHDALLAALDDAIGLLRAAADSDAGAQAIIDAGGPPLDDIPAQVLFPRCPAP